MNTEVIETQSSTGSPQWINNSNNSNNNMPKCNDENNNLKKIFFSIYYELS